MDNKATQQQLSSKEGSKECTILNRPTIDKEKSAQGRPSRATGTKPQGSAPAAPTTWAGGPPQAPQSLNQVQASRIHQNAMTPMDPPKHPQMARAQVLPSQKRHRQMQMQPHSLQTLLLVLIVVKVATEAKTVHIIICFVIFVE